MHPVFEQVRAWAPSSVAIGVASRGGALATYGDIDQRLPFASVTKPLTAYAVLLAAQDGLLHLDEPAGPADASPDLTVRHLLAHASGLPPAPEGPAVPPGQRRIYSDHGFAVLGALLTQRAGTDLATHLDVEVLAPLGMAATRLEGPAGSGAVGTVRDLLRFAGELLDPKLLDPARLRAATEVAFPGLAGVLPGFGRQTPNDWGLGFELKGTKRPHWTGELLSPRTFGHFGRAGSFLWVDPVRELACVELSDLAFGPWAAEVWPGFSDDVVRAFSRDARNAREAHQTRETHQTRATHQTRDAVVGEPALSPRRARAPQPDAAAV